MNQIINLGGFQSPYFEQEITLQPKENRVINYAFDDFQLLDASLQNTLEVTFGGGAIQSKFSAGMGYKLPAPVQYVQFFNSSSEQPITIRFVLAIGDIRDNRLVVSGIVNTSTELTPASSVTWAQIDGSAGEQTYDLPLNSTVSILVTSGTATLNLSNNTGTSITLQAGQTVDFKTANAQVLSVTGGVINIQIEEF